MVRSYEIVDPKGVSCGILTYDTKKDSYNKQIYGVAVKSCSIFMHDY